MKKILVICLITLLFATSVFAQGDVELGGPRPERTSRYTEEVERPSQEQTETVAKRPSVTRTVKTETVKTENTKTERVAKTSSASTSTQKASVSSPKTEVKRQVVEKTSTVESSTAQKPVVNKTSNKMRVIEENEENQTQPIPEVKFAEPAVPAMTYAPTSNYIESTGWVNAKGDTIGSISGLNVAKYRIRGEGPNGTVLDWTEFNSKKIVFSNVERGIWTLYVEAISEDGEPIAKGTIKTFLSNDSPLTTIKLNEEGTGAVNCTFYWSGEQTVNPTLKIFMKDYNGTFKERPASEITIEGNVAYWKASNIPSGSYVVRTELYDNEGLIGGSAAAMRVLDRRVSVGEIEVYIQIIPNKHGIAITGVPTGSVRGSLGIITSNDTLLFQSKEDPAVKLVYQWYIDGKEVNIDENSKELPLRTFLTDRGYHQIACIPAKIDDPSSLSTFIAVVGYDGKTYGYFKKNKTATETKPAVTEN